MMNKKLIINLYLAAITLLCATISSSNGSEAGVTLYTRVFQDDKDSVDVRLFTGDNTTLTLYDALVEAARVNHKFEFTGIKYSFGYYVQSIGGVAENRNKSKYWFIYKISFFGEEYLETGISSTIVKDNERYLFWYKKDDHSRNSVTNSSTNTNICVECDTNSVAKENSAPIYKRIWSVFRSFYDFIKKKL